VWASDGVSVYGVDHDDGVAVGIGWRHQRVVGVDDYDEGWCYRHRLF
jgi:hypothetical protein